MRNRDGIFPTAFYTTPFSKHSHTDATMRQLYQMHSSSEPFTPTQTKKETIVFNRCPHFRLFIPSDFYYYPSDFQG